MKFFSTFAASFLAVIIGILVGIPLVLLFFAGIAAAFGGSGDEVVVQPNSILKIQLKESIVENYSEAPFSFDFGQFSPLPIGGSPNNIGLYQIVENIEKAKNDESISGIYINLQGFVNARWATLRTIRKALLDFKESEKFIYAYSETYGEQAYYLASAADTIAMPPSGMMEFNGFSSTPMFYKGLFDKIDVEPKIFRVGTFKSAVEPYLGKKMSEANRAQTTKYLTDLWSVFADDISISRGLQRPEVDRITETFAFGDGKAAHKAGLINLVAYEDQMLRMLKRDSGQDEADPIEFVTFNKYFSAPKTTPRSGDRNKKIAVIFAEGEMYGGKSSDGTMGSETIVKELRKAREDDKIKAVVLRVNSPGGSVIAADVIYDEIQLTRKEKPVIASMGDLAASGGYYISAPCDRIFASENTLTGSIGVFMVLWNTQQMFNNQLGITFDEVETHPYANLGNPNYPMSEAEEKLLQKTTNETYQEFLEIVREGRGFSSTEEVDKIAQGRVWSGAEAKKIGLIDEFGGLDQAVVYAAEKAELGDDYRLELLPKTKDPFDALLEDLMKSMGPDFALAADHPLYPEWKRLEEIKKRIPRNGMNMLMPYLEEIK
ncbi:UNVERIFIED_CONTAM: hypothetical protein GTU68_043519 [Idotea baltica]|nr:hypothetical protein [Idotea baltica]